MEFVLLNVRNPCLWIWPHFLACKVKMQTAHMLLLLRQLDHTSHWHNRHWKVIIGIHAYGSKETLPSTSMKCMGGITKKMKILSSQVILEASIYSSIMNVEAHWCSSLGKGFETHNLEIILYILHQMGRSHSSHAC